MKRHHKKTGIQAAVIVRASEPARDYQLQNRAMLALSQKGQHREAYVSAQAYLKKPEKLPAFLLVTMGNICSMVGEYKQAGRCFDLAAKQRPEDSKIQVAVRDGKRILAETLQTNLEYGTRKAATVGHVVGTRDVAPIAYGSPTVA